MKSYLTFAIKELKNQKVMAILILIAIILSSIMTTAIGQSLGILKIMRTEQAASLNGDRYVTFHGLTENQVLELENNSELYNVNSLINIGYSKMADSSLTLYTREYIGNALNSYPAISKVKYGHLPNKPLEIALPENALQYFDRNINIGDNITLQAEISLMDSAESYSYSSEFMVCGILESNYIGYSSGVLDAIVGEGTADLLLPKEYLLYSTDFKTKNTAQFQAVVDEIINKLSLSESSVQYNWVLLNALGISYNEKDSSDTDTGFSFMTLAGIIVGTLVLLAAGLVIYNIMKIAVTKRIKEYGTLRAIGGERSQIYRLVSLQILILCGIGIPIGLIIGALSAKGILIAATGALNPDLFMVSSTSELNQTINATNSNNMIFYILSIAITIFFSMLATLPAARYASHVSPTVAMSGQKVKIKRHNRKVKAIRNFEAYYAKLNLKRGRGRTVITILSLVMSISVFVSLQSFITILDTAENIKDTNLGDYAITNENLGIDEKNIEQIKENDLVESLSTTKLKIYTQDETGQLPITLDLKLQTWEAFHIVGIDENRLRTCISELSERDIKELESGVACIVKNPIAFSAEGQTINATTLEYDDIITVNNNKMRVVGIIDMPFTINNEGFINGVQIIVNDKLFNTLTGINRYSEIYPILKQKTDSEQFEVWLENWCNANPGSHWLSYKNMATQLEESFKQINLLCWGLILFIALIGILNIINTVYSNIHTRICEIGMQRAIGMSATSLYKTFLWEGAYYGIIAAVVGGALGYVCTIFINAATTATIQLSAIPYIPIFEATIISIIACLLATAIPLRSIAKMDIVTSIEAVD